VLNTERRRHLWNRIRYGMPERYGHLANEIIRNRFRTILEIGVWDGEHAQLMIGAALRNRPPDQVAYHGVDLFEAADEALLAREVSKPPPPMESVSQKLQRFRDLGVSINLYQGNTTELLPQLVPSLGVMDFMFIDGGHSYETVSSDWNSASRLMGSHSVVLFDDYVNTDAIAHENYGVNMVVDSIDRSVYSVFHLRPADLFEKEWGTLRIKLVKVTNSGSKRT
jgi:hypothetical protein